jgi:hypothetical protein
MPAGFSPAARASDVYVEAMILASPHSAITSAHCLVGVGYTDTLNHHIRVGDFHLEGNFFGCFYGVHVDFWLSHWNPISWSMTRRKLL